MRRLRIVLPIFGIVILSLSPSCRSDKTEAPAPSSLSAIPVTTVPVVRQKISEKVTYTGTLEAWQKINITPEIGGKVAKIHVEEGQHVRKDQLLAELDTESLRLQSKQAEAAVNLARYALDVSLMKAPFDGIVASKNTQVGEVINPMMGGYGPASGVLTLVDYSRIKIGVDVSLSDIVRIYKGQPATVRAAVADARAYSGTVTVVNTTADPLSKKFHCEVTVDNPALALRPGTFGSVDFEIHSHDGALVVPQRAVIDNTYVFLVQGAKAVKKEVSLGLKNSLLIEVTDGLKEGDQVIVEGNFGLIDGSPVEIKR